MGLRNWVKHKAKKAAHEIEKTADEAGDAIKDTTEDAIGQAERLTRQAEEGVKNETMSIIDDVRKVANKSKKEVEDIANKAKGEIKAEANKAKNDIVGTGYKVKCEVESAGKKAVSDAGGVVQHALSELEKAVAKEGLKKSRDMVRAARNKLTEFKDRDKALASAIDKVGFNLKLGPITLSYSNFYSRSYDLVTALDRFASEPPAFRRGPVLKLITALGPDSINVGASVQFALVIGSNELGVGAKLSNIPLVLGTEIADVVMEKLGVPA